MLKRLPGLRRASACCGLAVAMALTAPAAAQTPPPQPGPGQLGGQGPCGTTTYSHGFAPDGNYSWLYVPTGTGTPRTGGSCGDASRPVILFAPGWSGIMQPSNYSALIQNMVSNGYAVAFSNVARPNPEPSYRHMRNGYKFALTTLNGRQGNRLNLAHIGIWGHSFGAGATPMLAQFAVAEGWGASSMWVSAHASSWVFMQGPYGQQINIAPHIRVQVVAYNDDTVVDERAAIDWFKSLSTDDSKKDFIRLMPRSGYTAGHSLPSMSQAPNYLEYYGVYRNFQAIADCARSGANCSPTVYQSMGNFSDGPAPAAVVTDQPVDNTSTPGSAVECFTKSSQTDPNPGRCSKQ